MIIFSKKKEAKKNYEAGAQRINQIYFLKRDININYDKKLIRKNLMQSLTLLLDCAKVFFHISLVLII
jgi:hypothetical protein